MGVGPHPAVGRLRKRAEFLAVARGPRFHTERITVQGRRRGQPGATDEAEPASKADKDVHGLRVGFTLTRKVGHATERNRIRRRLKAALACSATPFAERPVDVVVVGRRPAMDAPFLLLIDDLARALRRVTADGPPRTGRGRAGPPHEPDSHV